MEKLKTIQDKCGQKIVLIPEIIFTNKQNIDWAEVEKYLKRYVGEIATDKTFRKNHKEKHNSDAGNGWYYYTTRFALPIYDNEAKTNQYNIYTGCLVVNRTSGEKMYLYDLVDIKKEASNPLRTTR